MTIDLDDVNRRIADGIYDDGRLSKRDQEAAFAALAEIVAEVERLRAERDHFREAWAAAQVRLDCGTDAAEALREERVAVVAWLRERAMVAPNERSCLLQEALANSIERGAHRRQEG
jgi:hypothetical protein